MQNLYQTIVIELLKRMPQEELGRELETDQATISRWKAGRIPSNLGKGVRLMAIAEKHGISVSPELAQGEGGHA